jgi:hypothetical protein
MKIKSLAIIAVSSVLLFAGISVAGANPIAIHDAAAPSVAAAVPPPRRGPQPPQPTRGPAAPQIQAIRMQCGVGQVNNVDPIVMPGMPAMSHYHQFFGNTSTNENTTVASLLANRTTTCSNRADFSAYWAPQLWQGSTAIAPTKSIPYRTALVTRYNVNSSSIRLPIGLQSTTLCGPTTILRQAVHQ